MRTPELDRPTWRKSSYSGGGNGNCVEMAWTKSSYSDGGNGGCVEMARRADLVAVRDSKNPSGPTLAFPPGAWHALTDHLG